MFTINKLVHYCMLKIYPPHCAIWTPLFSGVKPENREQFSAKSCWYTESGVEILVNLHSKKSATTEGSQEAHHEHKQDQQWEDQDQHLGLQRHPNPKGMDTRWTTWKKSNELRWKNTQTTNVQKGIGASQNIVDTNAGSTWFVTLWLLPQGGKPSWKGENLTPQKGSRLNCRNCWHKRTSRTVIITEMLRSACMLSWELFQR